MCAASENRGDGLTANGNPTATGGDDGNGVATSVGLDSDHDRV